MTTEEEARPKRGIATCQNEKCTNYQKPFYGFFYENADHTYRGHCAKCGQPTKVEISE